MSFKQIKNFHKETKEKAGVVENNAYLTCTDKNTNHTLQFLLGVPKVFSGHLYEGTSFWPLVSAILFIQL